MGIAVYLGTSEEKVERQHNEMLRLSQLAALSLEFGRDKSGHSPFKVGCKKTVPEMILYYTVIVADSKE